MPNGNAIPGRNRRVSLTLVEVLFTIIVLSVLIAFLLPWIQDSRERARRISCLSNLRQIGMGIKQYATDHKDFYPESGTPTVESNFRLLSNMVGNAGQIFKCPSDKVKVMTNRADLLTDINISYCYVRGLDDSAPIDMPLCFDRGMGVSTTLPVTGYVGRTWLSTDAHGRGGGNVLFAGAHVSFNTAFPAIPLDTNNLVYTNEVLTPR